MYKLCQCLLLSIFAPFVLWAQQQEMPLTKNPDSIPKLQVVSEYEPSTLLKGMEFVRPQLSVSKAQDTLRLSYKIRPASLSIPYEAIRLNPLAYEVVKRPNEYTNYFSVYSGNTFLKVPKMRLSLGLGNGRDLNFRIYASHIAERGKINLQKYRDIEWKVLGQVAHKIASFRFGLTGSWLDYYRYGVMGVKGGDTLKASQLRNLLQNYAGFFKTDVGIARVNFNFSAQLDYSRLGSNTQEFATRLHLAIMQNKAYNPDFSWFGIIGYKSNFLSQQLPRLKPQDTINQILFTEGQFSYQHKTIGFSALFNLSYAFHQKKFYYLPQAYFYYKINQDIVRLHLGWETNLKMQNLLTLFKKNYFLSAPNFRYATTYNQKWLVGVNGSWKDHLDYSLHIFYRQQKDLPLLVNTINEPYSFSVYPVSNLRSVGIRGAINYKLRNRLKVSASFENNNYPFAKEQFYGLSPFTVRGSVVWQRVLRIITFKMSALWKMGSTYRLIIDENHAVDGVAKNVDNNQTRLPSYADLSVSMRIRVVRFLELYTELHNLLNRQNPLWLYYNEMPFSVGGGLIFYFRTKALGREKPLPAS